MPRHMLQPVCEGYGNVASVLSVTRRSVNTKLPGPRFFHLIYVFMITIYVLKVYCLPACV